MQGRRGLSDVNRTHEVHHVIYVFFWFSLAKVKICQFSLLWDMWNRFYPWAAPKNTSWIKLRWHLGLENIWHCGEIIQFLTWFATFFFWLSKCFASFHGCFWAFVWFKNENIFVFIKWITVITFVLGLFLKDEIVLGFIQATYL